MKFAKEGNFFLYPLFILFIIILSISWYFNYSFYFSLVLFMFLIFGLIFFRDPERNLPNEENIIISPADGIITKIQNINDPQLGESLIISIFLNVYNVHVNRMPINGKIIKVNYVSGKFLAAFDHKSSDENERTEILIDTKIGMIKIKQIAGLIAKRIICYAIEGKTMQIGNRLGFIRFGSRTDLILPKDVNLKVNVGEKVIGNETIIAKF